MKFEVFSAEGSFVGLFGGANANEAFDAFAAEHGYKAGEQSIGTRSDWNFCELEADVWTVDDDTYITLDNIEFTCGPTRNWEFVGDNTWSMVEHYADCKNLDPDNFWAHYEPRLDAIMGWDK